MESLNQIKEYLLQNQDKLNLSFNYNLIKENNQFASNTKIKLSSVKSKIMLPVIPFYKKITRFL